MGGFTTGQLPEREFDDNEIGSDIQTPEGEAAKGPQETPVYKSYRHPSEPNQLYEEDNEGEMTEEWYGVD